MDRRIDEVFHEALAELGNVCGLGSKEIDAALNLQTLQREAGVFQAPEVSENRLLLQVQRAGLHAVVQNETGPGEGGRASIFAQSLHPIQGDKKT